MARFDQKYNEWAEAQLARAEGRRKEWLEKGIGQGTMEFLRSAWFPAVGHFEHLHAEWEVRDFHNGYRYLDLAYLPGPSAKGAIEVQGYRSHARDLDMKRFKDLCYRHSLLSLDGWLLLPVAYQSLKEEPKMCQQLVLAFIGKFLSSTDTPERVTWLEAETLRFARRLLRPIAPLELAEHLRVSDRQARRVMRSLVAKNLLVVASGHERYRTYRLVEAEEDLKDLVPFPKLPVTD